MKTILSLIPALILASTLAAQIPTDVRLSGSLPTNCGAGESYYKTGTSAGLYVCVAGTWTLAGGGIPGGTNGQIQVNSSGAFGGVSTTGSGNVVLATSPTLVTPALGTPSAINLTNATGAPTWNQNTTGNAATATALASAPSLCTTGNAPTGILANGNATGCASITGGSGLPITASGSAVATATTLNFLPGTGITQSVTNASGTVSYQPTLDTTIALTYASFQTMGSVPLTVTSASSTTYTANAALSASTFALSQSQALVWPVGSTSCAGGAMTLSINGSTAHNIVEADGVTTLASSECTANTPVSLVYDATNTVFRKVGGTGSSISGTSGHIPVYNSGGNGLTDSGFTTNTAGTNNALSIVGGSNSNTLNLGTGVTLAAPVSGGNLNLGGFAGVDVYIGGLATEVVSLGQSNTDASSIFYAKVTFTDAVLTTAAPTVAASQVGLGSTTAAVSNCGATATACLVINVAGTTRYIPYY